jgi:hypothetical protein
MTAAPLQNPASRSLSQRVCAGPLFDKEILGFRLFMPKLKILLDTFSIFGTKELVYRAERKKFISFSDSGGLGQPVKINLSFDSFCRQSVLALQLPGSRGRGFKSRRPDINCNGAL